MSKSLMVITKEIHFCLFVYVFLGDDYMGRKRAAAATKIKDRTTKIR